MIKSYAIERLDEKLGILGGVVKQIAKLSRDPSTQVGALIMDSDLRPVSWGYNGFPAGMSDNPQLYADREKKLERVLHAEVNAILNMRFRARYPNLYMLCTHHPCHRCMVQIIQAGVKKVFFEWDDAWQNRGPNLIESLKLSRKFATEAGVALHPAFKYSTPSLVEQ